ncbi:hypothetical protein [Rhizobium sp. CSW-27]|uniref:hypothetical protein n=1 Tax=Rhizobium sp. CSW-27 TaxID=2839985 RepID=UPI001C009D78|nr:hypothetical protein [Rhizobium sp. CSW-27]MBT9373124.1 hypothetical protein [Rhizobium sp. CSW-27]
MTDDWHEPARFEAHRLLRDETSVLLPMAGIPSEEDLTLSVEEVFHSGLITDVVRGPRNEINTRIDAFFDDFQTFPLLGRSLDLQRWGKFATKANLRRKTSEPILGLKLTEARNFINSAPGRFLVKVLPFENRERQNDTHELLYFRDSGIHRRLIERTVALNGIRDQLLDSDIPEDTRFERIKTYEPKRWEAFVVTTIVDLVGSRCDAFAYRHEETREIDLVLEWKDHAPPERWAIEVTSIKFNTHPSGYFAEECEHLGVKPENRFVVRRLKPEEAIRDVEEFCRGGVPAISLPRMVRRIKERLEM